MWLTWLADAARMTGWPVIEVPGWRSRGHGAMTAAEGVVLHHTAGPKTGNYPSLGVVRDGRPGLAGPLAQLGLGRDGTIYVIAAGLAYHAGESRWAGFTSLNSRFIGVEAESTGVPVFGRYDWTDAQLDAYPRLVAALLHWMRRPADRAASHAEVALPAGRKIDPAGIDMRALRTTVTRYLTTPASITRPGGSMSETAPTLTEIRGIVQDELAVIAKRVDVGFARDQVLTALGVANPGSAPAAAPAGAVAVSAKLDELAAAVRAGGVDPAAVLAAVRAAFGGGLVLEGTVHPPAPAAVPAPAPVPPAAAPPAAPATTSPQAPAG